MKTQMKAKIAGITLVVVLTTMIFLSNSNAQPSLTETSGKIMVLYIDGIEGESKYAESQNEHDIISFSWGAHGAREPTGASRRRGSVVLEDLYVIKELDSSSPKIMEKICREESINEVKLRVFWNGAQYWEYKLENVYVTSLYTGGSGTSDEPDLESISFTYTKITMKAWEYDEQGNSQGMNEFVWDIENPSGV